MLSGSGNIADQNADKGGNLSASRLAWSGAIFSIALVTIALGFALYLVNSASKTLVPPPHMFFSPVTTAIFSITGLLIATRHPKNPIGWLFELVGFLSAMTLMATVYYGMSQLNFLPKINLVIWLQAWVWIPTNLIPLSFLLLLFPDGRLISGRWRIFLIFAIVGLVGVLFAVGFHPSESLQQAIGLPERNPLAINGAGEMLSIMLYSAGTILGIAILGSVISIIIRFRRSQGVKRTQMKWLAYAGLFVIISVLVASALAAFYPGDPTIEELTIIITDLAVAGVAIATGIAIMRHGLYDINLLFNRTIVYGTLTVSIIGIYVLLVGLLSTLIQSQGSLLISLAATGIVAVVFQPLRERLQQGVNQLIYGDRDEPYVVISRLGRRLEDTLASEAVLSTITDTVAQALKLPYVAVSLKREDGYKLAYSFGKYTEDHFILPLRYQKEEIGQLICGYRSPGEPFNSAEKNLLNDIAHQASVAVHASELTSDLKNAHRRLVRTREEERRRIRRDLHDGLGPILASNRLKIGTASDLLQQSPLKARKLLEEAEAGLNVAVDDIRRLVHGLRPPALDEMGLVKAVKQNAPQVPNLDITYNVPEEHLELPAAVDVAAFRIIQEAVSNCVKHAQANLVCISIEADDHLILSIRDNGIGLAQDYQPGVGLISMKERAQELGGTFELISDKASGTTIIANIPIEDFQL
jgi:signal transduction histidine kinase